MTTHPRRIAIQAGPVSGVLLFTLAAEFMIAIMLAASLAPAYDFNGGAISDLGVIRQTALLFNFSLLFVGVLNIAGGYLFYRARGHAWVLVLFVLAGLGAIGAGAFPLSTGNLHAMFALLAFVFFNLEAIACALVVRGPMRLISAMAGTIGIGFVVLMVIGDAGNPAVFGPMGHGGAERMIVYPTYSPTARSSTLAPNMAGAAMTAAVMRVPSGARAATSASRALAPIPLVVI